ncbi:MAG: ribosome-associated heat shock protein Hsp15 [Oceanospirillaceae bacterium]|jgi:ribosome-associated heat shock protein Hsp15
MGNKNDKGEKNVDNNIRLDKWLWAARFYRTRALAKQAIEGGKVHYQGTKAKCSRVVELQAQLKIRFGADEKTIVVLGLSGSRRGAPEASLMYSETAVSEKTRSDLAASRKAMGQTSISDGKPTKKQRRDQQRFEQQQL